MPVPPFPISRPTVTVGAGIVSDWMAPTSLPIISAMETEGSGATSSP